MRVESSVIITTVIILALFSSRSSSVTQLTTGLLNSVENWSFEVRDYSIPGNGVYECPPWETNNGGWRECRGDVDGNGFTEVKDLLAIVIAYGSYPGHPNWNPDADLNGDGFVDVKDVNLASSDYGNVVHCVDGYYSWYTSGGGDYEKWQWLDVDDSMALAGETVEFSFSFYPESVSPDGSQNNARAEIYYILNNLQEENTVLGTWVAPTSLGWWDAHVIAQLPSNVLFLAVIIHGTPDFKAWIDSAELGTWYRNIYYRSPPYSNQQSYPENNTRVDWANAAIAAVGNPDTGLVLVYAWDQSGVGSGKMAYVKFNSNPPTGNSPSKTETDDFRISVYWYLYGYFGYGMSALRVTLSLYYLQIGTGWVKVDEYTFGFDSIQYPNQEIFCWQSVSFSIPSPPSGNGIYSITAKGYAYAAGDGYAAVADALYDDYAMYIDLLKISD